MSLPVDARSGSPGQEFGGWTWSQAAQQAVSPSCNPKRKRGQLKQPKRNENKENKTMSGTVLQAVLWIVAGLFLTLLILRRSKRKASRS